MTQENIEKVRQQFVKACTMLRIDDMQFLRN